MPGAQILLAVRAVLFFPRSVDFPYLEGVIHSSVCFPLGVGGEKININTAPCHHLLAIDGVGTDICKQVCTKRQSKSFRDIADLALRVPKFPKAMLSPTYLTF